MRGPVIFLLTLLAALLSLAAPAHARGSDANFAPGSLCHAVAAPAQNAAALAAPPPRWNCDLAAWPAAAEGLIVRIDQRLAGQTADYLSFRRQRFSSLEVQAIGADGAIAARRYGPDDLVAGEDLWDALVPVPTLDVPPVAIVLTIEHPGFPGRLRDIQTVTGPPFERVAALSHLFAALLCGLLLAPAFFDLGFCRTLRQRFPLYHALFCVLAAINTATATGLTQILLAPDPQILLAISVFSFDLMIAASTLFMLSFVEPGTFAARERRIARLLPPLVVCLGLLNFFGPDSVGALAAKVYYTGYLVFIVTLLALVWRGWRRGSRAIRFVLLAYTPLIMVGLLRIGSTLFGPAQAPIDGLWQQCLALAFEVVVTSFAVADRFMTIKRERDRARSEARVLEVLSERDPLTGLLNRRALEARFADLRAHGYTALATIDLDHFKTVNDRFGHAAGDAVLRCVANVLSREDDKTLAFRMGGEEFVLLLRGKDALARAEAMRQAIPAAAEGCAGSPVRVTASMGLVEAPPEALPETSFAALYERADRLLYEAKQSGRDRTASERLKLFRHRRRADRRVAA